MTATRDVLRLHIPIDALDAKQRKRAVAVGNRVEAKVAAMLAGGFNPDRLMALVEGYFLDDDE
jgi:hypothetical protein